MKVFYLLLTFCCISTASEKPNILYLYVDDMGWGSIGPNGQYDRKKAGKPYVLTPNLDRLADSGINFTRAYGCTVCSPARSSQQTGFHQGYTFADRNDPDNAKKAIRKDDLTMGDMLSKAGYATGYWGKWGYGGSKDHDNPSLDNIQTLPTSHGYQFVVAELHHVRAHTFFQPTLWNAPTLGKKGGLILKPNSMAKYKNNKKYPNYPADQNNKNYPDVAYCDDVYAFAALDFVRNQAMNYNKTGQPFFGLFAAQIPHAPFDEVAKLPNWDAAYKDKVYFKSLKKQSQQWCAMVTRIDAHFGNIIDALEDPNGDGDKSDSVAHNTLIIFQSDNGGANGTSRIELASNGILSGGKGSIMEGGIRVPTIMKWPIVINHKSELKAGANSDMVIDCSDLLPTFCDLAGVNSPTGISGVSLAPYLSGKGLQRQRDFLIHEAGASVSIIKGDYKLVRNRQAKSKKKKQTKKGPALYDLKNDPGEKKNIAAKHPKLVKELNELLTAERVDEPAGFANTYHSWKGKSASCISKADSWSDYIYENAGKTYMNESGAPELHWIARMSTGVPGTAQKSVEFLGLEIGGGEMNQVLNVEKGVNVHGRNEIRIAKNGLINLKGGTLSSLRWIDILAGGILKGNGTIDADLYCNGTLELNANAPLVIKGTAYIDGILKVDVNSVASINGKTTFISAEKIVGKFTNTKVTVSGKTFKISYTDNAITLKAL